MSSSTAKSSIKKNELAERAPSALEQCTVESARAFCEGSVVLKGLPPDHVQADCMGEYVQQERSMNGRSLYLGGRDGDMALYFDNKDWVVTPEKGICGGYRPFLHVNDSAITPDLINAPWKVDQGRHPAPSLRVRKLGGRESVLEVSGLPSEHDAASCMGRYTRAACRHNGKPTYKGTRLADGMAIWFFDGDWCIGSKEYIGTDVCCIFAEECARTPAAVQSVWMAGITASYVDDERVQVCSALAQQNSPASANQAQQLSSAPPKLAIIGSDREGESCDGVYTKQQRETSSRVVYEGGMNGKQAMWYHGSGTWVVGEVKNVGTNSCHMSTGDPAATPDVVTGPWSVPLMVPCSIVRVSKSKKKHTKVIEVKGVPDGDANPDLALMNGKYRQSSMVGGRLTFKGGQDGRAAIWFEERNGKWRGGCVDSSGVAGGTGNYNYCMEATDTAASPNAVKAPWYILNGFQPSLYPNVIVPSVEAAEQEVPRLLQLTMTELLVAQQRRCLGCGHEYTAHAEVVFQIACMHHHCVCCEEEHGGDVCAVCAEEDGK
jgi:hypothetical protein